MIARRVGTRYGRRRLTMIPRQLTRHLNTFHDMSSSLLVVDWDGVDSTTGSRPLTGVPGNRLPWNTYSSVLFYDRHPARARRAAPPGGHRPGPRAHRGDAPVNQGVREFVPRAPGAPGRCRNPGASARLLLPDPGRTRSDARHRLARLRPCSGAPGETACPTARPPGTMSPPHASSRSPTCSGNASATPPPRRR